MGETPDINRDAEAASRILGELKPTQPSDARGILDKLSHAAAIQPEAPAIELNPQPEQQVESVTEKKPTGKSKLSDRVKKWTDVRVDKELNEYVDGINESRKEGKRRDFRNTFAVSEKIARSLLQNEPNRSIDDLRDDVRGWEAETVKKKLREMGYTITDYSSKAESSSQENIDFRSEMEGRLKSIEDQLDSLRAENALLRNILGKLIQGGNLDEADVGSLNYSGFDLKQEQINRLTGKAPVAAPAESDSAPAVVESPPAPQEKGVQSFSERAVQDFIIRYSPVENAGSGWKRGAAIPLAAGIGGGVVAEKLMGAGQFIEKIPILGRSALVAGAGSLTANALRRHLGENVFSLWAKYSHTERVNRKGGLVGIGQAYARAGERALMRRMVIPDGGDEMKSILSMYSAEQAVVSVPETLNVVHSERLIQKGVWYLAATQLTQDMGAYFTPEEMEKINTNRPMVAQVVDALANRLPMPTQTDLVSRTSRELINREARKYVYEALAMSELAAAKSFALSGLMVAAADNAVVLWRNLQNVKSMIPDIHAPNFSYYSLAGIKLPDIHNIQWPKLNFNPNFGWHWGGHSSPPISSTSHVSSTGHEVFLPNVGVPSQPSEIYLPHVGPVHGTPLEPSMPHSLPTESYRITENIPIERHYIDGTITRTVGHTIKDKLGFVPWGVNRFFAGIIEANSNNALFWQTAHDIAGRVGDQGALDALTAAGYNQTTHVLDHPEAIGENYRAMMDILHWTVKGMIIKIPDGSQKFLTDLLQRTVGRGFIYGKEVHEAI